MKIKKITCVTLAALMLTSAFSLFGCRKKQDEIPTRTRMTVDVNPSVEFILDENNKVISATAMNDDAGVLLVGEAFVGKSSEDAVEMMLSIATETGYLVKGNVEASENTVSISVTGDKKVAAQLLKSAHEQAVETLEELDVPGKVEQAAALAADELREVALAATAYTEEQLEKLDINELNHAIAEARVETALLLSSELREAYVYAKEYELSFAEREETAKVIEAMGGVYKVTHTTYKVALDAYNGAIKALNEFRYKTLVDPDSIYQKLLTALRDAKSDLLIKRTMKASLTIDDDNYIAVSKSFELSETAYNAALDAFVAMGNQANESLMALIEAMRKSEKHLVGLEDVLFNRKIERKLKKNADELEKTLNTVKDNFFNDFEKAHADDIETINAQLLAKKNELKTNNQI